MIRPIGRVLLFMFTCAFSLAFIGPFIPKLPAMWSEVCLAITTSGAALGLTFLFARWEGVRLSDVGAAPAPRSPIRFVVGFSIGLAIAAAWAALLALSGTLQWAREVDTANTTWPSALLAYIALSTREELAFRGYPLRTLERPLTMWGAQLFVAVMFAFEHVLGGAHWIQAVLGAGTGSLLFGMAALATRGLAVPIGVHAAWNFGHWMLGMKGRPGFWRGVVDPANTVTAEAVGLGAYVLVTLVATFGFWLLYRKSQFESQLTTEM